MRLAPALVMLATACSGRTAVTTPVAASEPAAPAGPNAFQAPAPDPADPWSPPPTAPKPGNLPTTAETHALAEAACPTVAKPYLWKIEKAGQTSFILGTRHLGVGVEKMPPVVRDTVAHAKLAVFEVAPDDTTGATPTPSTELLSKQLGAASWAHLRDLAGDSLAAQLNLAPASTALIQLEAMYEDKSHALDLEFETIATTAHVPTAGLETSAFQDKLIDQLMDVKALRAALVVTQTRADLESDSKDDLASYCAGSRTEIDPKERADMLRGGYTEADADAYEDEIVYSRNRDWIPKLEPILSRGNAFIAVGADHLMGPRGVPALLTARGYTLTRVTP